MVATTQVRFVAVETGVRGFSHGGGLTPHRLSFNMWSLTPLVVLWIGHVSCVQINNPTKRSVHN
jgi:hypothetical protein